MLLLLLFSFFLVLSLCYMVLGTRVLSAFVNFVYSHTHPTNEKQTNVLRDLYHAVFPSAVPTPSISDFVHLGVLSERIHRPAFYRITNKPLEFFLYPALSFAHTYSHSTNTNIIKSQTTQLLKFINARLYLNAVILSLLS